MRNKDNKINTTEINRKFALGKRSLHNRSISRTKDKRKEWGI